MGHALDVLRKGFYTNNEGYTCFRRDWREEYLQMLLTNTISNVFYASEEKNLGGALELHAFAADEDPEFMARALVYARNEGFMRLQPILGLAVLSLASPRLFQTIFRSVIQIVPDLVEFSLALESFGRGQGGRMIKRAAAGMLLSIDEHAALKYAGGGRGYALRDLLRVYHPKAIDKNSTAIFRYLLKGLEAEELETACIPQIMAFERFKRASAAGDEAAAIAAVKEGRLPYTIVTGAASAMTTKLWLALLPGMPLFALLRHLVTLERSGVLNDAEAEAFVIARLTNDAAVKKAKILPFRFVQAWMMVSLDSVKSALSRATELSVSNLPRIDGTSAILLDISGSMQGQYLMAGALLAFSIIRKTGGRGRLITFNTEAQDLKINEEEPILEAAAKITCWGGTDTSAGLVLMTKERSFADNIIIITDEQQNAGSAFHKMLRVYRDRINPSARVFIVNVAPYTGAMVPSEDHLTSYCYGWSDQIVSLIERASSGYGDLIGEVASIDLNAALPKAC